MNVAEIENALTLRQWLAEIDRRLGLNLNELQNGLFLDFIGLMREWNEKVNLTTVLDDEGVALKHLLDSLTLLPYLPRSGSQGPCRLIDVGAGAGFPGVPLKIARPELEVVLLDSLAKRVKYLEAVIAALQLPGIEARHGRAEDTARIKGLRESFDVAAARAVAALPALCEYCLPFVRIGGVFLAMKGQGAEDWRAASRAIKTLGGEMAGVDEFDLPGANMKRSIITIRKIAPTPAAFPRKAGRPEKDPL